METDKYFAIMKNGKFLESATWTSLNEKIETPDDVELFVAFFYDKPYIADLRGYGTHYYWPQIQILDANGTPTTYQRGAFKIKRIHPDEGSYYHKGRILEIENCLNNEIQSIGTPWVKEEKNFVRISDFYSDIIGILDDLNRQVAKQVFNLNL